jgi:AmmeMemoRadiSam system protein B
MHVVQLNIILQTPFPPQQRMIRSERTNIGVLDKIDATDPLISGERNIHCQVNGADRHLTSQGLMHVAAERALEVRLLDLRNSGDTAAERSRVVGYGAFALYETRVINAAVFRN